MSEQMNLFQMQDSYNLANLKQICIEYVKNRYPEPVEEEDFYEYQEFIRVEIELEYASRLHQIACQIEDRVLGKTEKGG